MTKAPTELGIASVDFLELLRVFYAEIFPQYARAPPYFAGESFGGCYAPYYEADLLSRQKIKLAGLLQETPLGGLILVNALVGSTWSSVGQYDLFCTDQPPNLIRSTSPPASRRLPPFQNASASPARARWHMIRSCAKRRRCSARSDWRRPSSARWMRIGAVRTTVGLSRLALNPLLHTTALTRSAKVRHDCLEPPLCGVGSDWGSIEAHLNRAEVQERLGFEESGRYVAVNFDLNQDWSNKPGHLGPHHEAGVLSARWRRDVYGTGVRGGAPSRARPDSERGV